jgi:hypothetical protein
LIPPGGGIRFVNKLPRQQASKRAGDESDTDSDADSDSSELAEYLKMLENAANPEELDNIVSAILKEMGEFLTVTCYVTR